MEEITPTNRFTVFYFLMQGIASQISWNAVLNGIDYFMIKYSKYDVYIIVPIVITLAQLTCCSLILKISQKFSLNLRIFFSLIILSLILIFLPLEASFFAGTAFGFYLLLGILFFMGFFNTVLAASLSGIVSLFPAKYASYNMIGTSCAGLLMNALRAFFLVSIRHRPYGDMLGITLYFGVSGLFVIGCMLIHPMFVRSDHYREHLVKPEEVLPSLAGDHEVELIKRHSSSGASRKDFRALLGALKEVYGLLLLMLLTQVQTFITFPQMMLKNPMEGMPLEWKLVTMVAAFQGSCAVGQQLAQYKKHYNQGIVVFTIIFRTIFAALFIVQAVKTDLGVINTVWFAYLNIFFFAATFGFVQTALFILATSTVQVDKKEVVGYTTVFIMILGVCLGAIFSLPLKNVGSVDLPI